MKLLFLNAAIVLLLLLYLSFAPVQTFKRRAQSTIVMYCEGATTRKGKRSVHVQLRYLARCFLSIIMVVRRSFHIIVAVVCGVRFRSRVRTTRVRVRYRRATTGFVSKLVFVDGDCIYYNLTMP